MKTNLNFTQLNNKRKEFMTKNRKKDHAIIVGKNNILLSAPHGVSQVRLGKHKFSEIGSLATALQLQEETDCHLIAKTQNNFDDANFDEVSAYKNSVEKIINENAIAYVVDFHGLAANRHCDINLGTHLGNNIASNKMAFKKLYDSLRENGFYTTIDQPFMASRNTISSTAVRNHVGLWAIQIEINYAITNKIENFEKYKLLLKVLSGWLKDLEKGI